MEGRYAITVTMAKAEGLFRSALSVRSLVALSQAGRTGLSLRQLARCLRIADSSAQAALRVLREVGALQREGTRYRLAGGPTQHELLVVALDHLPREEALGILVCANAAVEYASIARARAGLELIAIEGNDGDPLATEQLHEAMRAFRGDPRVRLIRELHDHIVEELRYPFSEAQRTRRRALGGQLLKGSAARSLPDRSRTRRYAHDVRPLHRTHPDLKIPRNATLRKIADDFGLEQLALFGSAVRSDFRPDSDVDVAVRYRPGKRRSLFDEIRLERALEQIFDRDVDVVVETELPEGIRPRADREMVTIHG